PQATHARRRRTAAPPSAERVSTTCVGELQTGQITWEESTRYVVFLPTNATSSANVQSLIRFVLTFPARRRKSQDRSRRTKPPLPPSDCRARATTVATLHPWSTTSAGAPSGQATPSPPLATTPPGPWRLPATTPPGRWPERART